MLFQEWRQLYDFCKNRQSCTLRKTSSGLGYYVVCQKFTDDPNNSFCQWSRRLIREKTASSTVKPWEHYNTVSCIFSTENIVLEKPSHSA